MENNWVKITNLHEININGTIRNIKTKRHIKPHINRGYLSVSLTIGTKKKIYSSVHRLLAVAFVKKENIYANEVDHIDRNTPNMKIRKIEFFLKYAWNILKILICGDLKKIISLLTTTH